MTKRVVRSPLGDEFLLNFDPEDFALSPEPTGIAAEQENHVKFINRTFQLMAKKGEPEQKNMVYVKDLPENVYNWPSSAHVVYKLFKVRTAVFDVDTILWPATPGINLFNWIGEAKNFIYCLDYLDRVLGALDIDESSGWYEHSQMQRSQQARALFTSISSEIDNSNRFARVNEKIKSWLTPLRTLLEMDPDNISEKTYEEVFSKFVEIVDLNCFRGNFFATMKFNYKDRHGVIVTSVSSVPDLLVFNVESFFDGYAVAVVEVKKDKALGKTSKKQRLDSADLSSTSGSPLASSSEEERSAGDKGEDDCSAMKEDYANGNPRLLTRDENEICQTFLPQLLGEVMAALNFPEAKLRTLPLITLPADHLVQKSVLGFGVVGFNVYVINFLCVSTHNFKKGPMHDVPLHRGIGTDILVTRALNVLKSEDRKKLFRLLIALKDFDK